MDGKLLKASILHWAIQGKLVSQNTKEESGEKLLERIISAREKESPPEKNKHSKKKPVFQRSRIYCDNGIWYEQNGSANPKDISEEILFEIPSNWVWCRWGELSDSIQYGYNAPALQSGRIKMVRISDIHDNKIEWDKVPYCQINENEIKTYLLKKNDILFARTGGTVGKSYLVGDVCEDAIYAGYLIRTRYNAELLNPQYLKFFMESPLYWIQLREGTIATAQPNCNGKKLAKMLLPLPPLAEQKRIVEKLNQIIPLVDEYGKLQKDLDELNVLLPKRLKKSILQEALQGKIVPQFDCEGTASEFIERNAKEKRKLIDSGIIKKKDLCSLPVLEEDVPFEIPETWQWVRFESVAQRFAGKTPQRGNMQYWANPVYPWVSISDMRDYGLVKSTKEGVSQKGADLFGSISHKGALLMSFKLTVGRTAILDIDAYHNEAIITVIPYYDKDNIFRDYLFTFLPIIISFGDSKDAIKDAQREEHRRFNDSSPTTGRTKTYCKKS